MPLGSLVHDLMAHAVMLESSMATALRDLVALRYILSPDFDPQ